jgi:hypothetical protein
VFGDVSFAPLVCGVLAVMVEVNAAGADVCLIPKAPVVMRQGFMGAWLQCFLDGECHLENFIVNSVEFFTSDSIQVV